MMDDVIPDIALLHEFGTFEFKIPGPTKYKCDPVKMLDEIKRLRHQRGDEARPDETAEALAILRDVVGLSWHSDTSTVTMTPDSFIRCIRRALSAPRPQIDEPVTLRDSGMEPT